MSTGYRKCTYLSPLCSHVTTFGLSAFSIYVVFPCSSSCHLTASCSLYYHSPFFSYLPSLSISCIYFTCLQSSLLFNTPFPACTNLFLTVASLCFCLSANHLLSSIPKFLPQIDSLSVVHIAVYLFFLCVSFSRFLQGFLSLSFHSYHFVTPQYSFSGIMRGGFILGEVQYEVNFCHIDRTDKIKHKKMVFTFIFLFPLHCNSHISIFISPVYLL